MLRLGTIYDVIQELPVAHYNLLKRLLALLHKVKDFHGTYNQYLANILMDYWCKD
jgi:hypothetical protein